MYLVAVLLLVIIKTALAADLPSQFKTCRRSMVIGYNECLAGAIIDAIIKLKDGYEPFGIIPLDPIRVNSISIGGNQRAVSLKQDYEDIEIHGLTKGPQFLYILTELQKLNVLMEVKHPMVNFLAKYKLDGKIVLLPVKGEGNANITMINVRTQLRVFFEKYQKDQDIYLRIKSFNVKLFPEKVHLQFDNLFNGDPILARPVETFMRQNSDSIFKELQTPYESSFGIVFAEIGNQLFNRVPMNKIFPD